MPFIGAENVMERGTVAPPRGRGCALRGFSSPFRQKTPFLEPFSTST